MSIIGWLFVSKNLTHIMYYRCAGFEVISMACDTIETMLPSSLKSDELAAGVIGGVTSVRG